MVGWLIMTSINMGKLDIEPSELRQMLASQTQPVLIDVREPDEYAAGTIPGAILIPLGQLEDSNQLDQIDYHSPIVVICRSGTRSAHAQQRLFGMGYKKVYNLKGGILAWDGPIE